MLVPNRHGSSSSYRYGFNGKEKDDEVKGEGVQYDYGFRIYDARIARFLSTDPLFAGYPYYSPYQFAGNRPIWAVDLDGLEEYTKTIIHKYVVVINGVYYENYVADNRNVNGAYSASSCSEVVQQGDACGGTEIHTFTTKYAGKNTYKVTESISFIPPTENAIDDRKIEAPAVDPNDNTKPINNQPIEDQEKPALQKINDNSVKEKVNTSNLNKVEKKVVNKPKVNSNKSPYKKGDVINSSLTGLIYPSVTNSGFDFISGGQFPAKDYLSELVKELNSSNINKITISGKAFHGNGTTSSNVKAAFYTGLLKLDKILHDLGLNKNIKIHVDYENTKAIKNEKTGVFTTFKLE